MNRTLQTHGSWLLVTIITFALGSQWVRSVRSDGDREGEAGSGGRSSVRAKSEYGARRGLGSAEELRAETAAGRTAERGSEGPDAELRTDQMRGMAMLATRSSSPLARRRAFDYLLEAMQAEGFDAEQALVMRAAMEEFGASDEQWRLFDYAWAANDPGAALAHLNELEESERDGFLGNMLPGLASVDPQSAMDLVAGREGEQRERMMGRLLKGLVDHDIGVATDYVYHLAENGNPGARRHMQTLSREILRTEGLEGGREWAEDLLEGPLQAEALVRVANDYAKLDPVAASQWAEQYIDGDQNSRIFGEVVREWRDWEAASEWVESLEPSQGQRDALSAVYGFRGAREPEIAVQDIINMPESSDRNFAINGFISGLAHLDGESAVLWAGEISTPGMRASAQIRAARHYFRQDPQAASEWFTSSGLPEGAWEQVTTGR